MKKNLLTSAVVLSLTLFTAMPASAALFAGQASATTNASTTVGGHTFRMKASANASTTVSTQAIATAKAAADKEIQARISALNDLQTRVNQMQKLSASDKSQLTANIEASIGDMTTLQATIDADTDLATLKTDIKSITKSYRIYVLVLPQGRIEAAADRVEILYSDFQTLSAALQTRISANASASNYSAMMSAYSDMNAKVNDANTQAQAAVSEIANLQPDNGDASVYASNEAALKDARAKIKTATSDLQAARKDAGTIAVDLKADEKASGSANTSSTASSTVNP